MIEVKALSKSFGKVKAVKEVSFVAPDNQVTALLGANGAGKTTSLRMIYSLITPESGEVMIDGINPQKEPEKARKLLGVLPDSRGLYLRLTARENIQYFGRLHGMSESQINSRIESLVEDLRMQDFIDRKTDGFSQGQRVKVAIARALVHDPQNIILDEPTNGLDVMSTRGVRSFLRKEKARGKCILFSSHVMQEVAAVSDEILIVNDGRVCASGTEKQLMEQTNMNSLEDAFVHIVTNGEGHE
ncbi:MAG TPA: ATP-binding cassette domain-containing protein [Gammaproteobacteria bacterium]|nr:ATP-binding cassette domain-containing protein [Xanthomonadales bacterium]MCB1594019.1 ATP-binding cassette domain-containing protein [Xanthomonadales bacterium]HOP21487.1 ATP-binding cassette domain-containing protein [Gammaproteobacteria bacterium]HPI95497.1 ATP-binding cassette domain-containing protein [Gammaproteobacteria bacterium]HPQ87240.1 ATP-binding cassette domain-containing protein [Gammaproteobacteria bacterium]